MLRSGEHSVAITGLGVIAPHGDDPGAMFDALMEGRSGLRRWEGATDPVVAGTVQFDPARWFTKLQMLGLDRVSQLAVAAAEMARADAKVQDLDPLRVGVFVGCGMGGAISIETAFRSHATTGRVPPLSIPAGMGNAPAAHIAMRGGFKGPVLSYCVACSSSAVAIAEAGKSIRAGEIDVAFAGGTEAMLVPAIVRAWQMLQTLATPDPERIETSCRPFALDRSGFVLSEGAAFLVLESAASAQRRGARIYADLVGSGLSCDATHLTKPDAAGQARAMKGALASAGLQPADVGYCNAHGTATPAGDVVECDALRSVWGDDLGALRVSSTKSMHGHLLGGAGALEAMITVLALHRGQIPPTAFCSRPDPKCAVPLVREQGEAAPQLRAAISNSFAFGGTNAVLAFQRHH
ncbi:MAG TPA: beta-ketoacyl-[acyl-carrier-protein] synthase family protein [Burkholderiaceae bacterium]|nr:beta-ketoacyl-[acyl-carrier-protein] synthase family protein [Burkholderiaceae bacterium]